MTTTKLTNLKMSDETYKLRRKVIDYIYEAKRIYPRLPRITVRITENDDKIAGLALVGGNTIWITSDYVAKRGVVFHEILHACFGVRHIPGCPLMAGKGGSAFLDDDTANKLFLRYARVYGN